MVKQNVNGKAKKHVVETYVIHRLKFLYYLV